MKILHVTEASVAGVLSSVTALAAEQSRLADVTFAYVPRPESPDPVELAQGFGDGVRVLMWQGRVRELALLRGLTSLLRREQFDVVHVHSSRAGVLGRVVAWLCGQTVVYSPHGFAFDRSDYPRVVRAVFSSLERAALAFGDRLVLVSGSERALASRVLPRAEIAVLANAVDTSELLARRAQRTATGGDAPIRVAHIGRISRQKRPELFSAVADLVLAEAGREVAFSWIGDGDRDTLRDDIRVVGWRDRSGVLAAMAEVDIVLFTSAGEGLPMALLESQGMGIPAVASSVTGIADIVREGETGVMGESARELADAVLFLVASDAERARMGSAAAEYVHADYDVERLGPQSIDVYRSLGARLPEWSSQKSFGSEKENNDR